MKYWIDWYKAAKDWNRNQSGGNRKQSIFSEEIDEILGWRVDVTLRHVAQAGSSSGVDAAMSQAFGPSSIKTHFIMRKVYASYLILP